MQYEFAVVRKGYDKEQVEEYINELLATIEGYKIKDEQTRNLVQLAEEKAKKIVEDAKEEAIREAKAEADKIIDGAYSKLYSIQETMQEQRVLLNDFRKDYNRFILKYVNEVNKRNFVQLQTSVDDIENYITETMKTAEKTKNGYFVPNPSKTEGPIIIVEPSTEDISVNKLQEHFPVDSNPSQEVTFVKTSEDLFFESNDIAENNNDVETKEDVNTNLETNLYNNSNSQDLDSELNTEVFNDFEVLNDSESLDEEVVIKEYDELFELTKEETLSKHLEEQETADLVQDIQDTLLNIKPIK